MEHAAKHVVIAGAGIIGLAVALELAEAGLLVTVLERGRAMREASWAAAGMLATDDPENAPELLPLSQLSRGLYPLFLDRVEQLSGLRVPLRTRQTLQGVHTSTSSGATAALPGLCTEHFRFHLLEEASLDPRDLCAALPLAAKAAGVRLLEQAQVLRARPDGGAVTVTLGSGEQLHADAFVLAAGGWSGAAGMLPGEPLPIAPRKGQMIEVLLSESNLQMVVRTPELYLVPRGDGRIVIGSTVEWAGFDTGVDTTTAAQLLQAAGRLWTPVLRGRITAQWAGLRPGFEQGIGDALPLIGSIGRPEDGIWVATGHFRNGILLAPGTARVLRHLICGEKTSIAMAAFAPARFTQVAPF